MLEAIANYFSTGGFMPHGHCYLWKPSLVGAMVVSDALIGLSYLSISLTLYALIRRIRLPFSAMFLAFGLFIAACGLTHFMEIYTLWIPDYWLSAGVKVVTAGASVATALLLFPIRPKVVALAESAQASIRNKADLEGAYAEMESRVEARARELGEANRALAESEERFRQTFECAAVGIAHIDREGRWLMVNPRLCSILGAAPEDLVGKFVFDVTHPDDVPQARRLIEATVRGEIDNYRMEKRYVRKDGGLVWVARSVSAVRDGAGALKYFISVVEDISARKAAEAEKERFAALVQNSTDFIAIAGQNQEMVFMNRAGRALLGVGKDELPAVRLEDVFSREERERVAKELIPIVNAEGHWSGEVSFRDLKTGRLIPSLTTAFLIQDPATGERNALACVARDITDLKNVEDLLRESEEHFRTLAEAMPQLVWSSDPDGNPTYANERCITYTGYDVVQKRNGGWAQALHPDDAAMVFAKWMTSMKSGEVFQAEYRMRRKDGAFRWFIGRSVPVRDKQGRIKSWIGTATDIDEQKRAEEQLKNSNEVLETEVQKRTSELTEANTRLVAANHELEAFCYSVSHDLRAPLRGIDGFSQALLDDYDKILDDSGRQYLGFVREGIQRMGRIIDDLLNLSRLTRAELRKEDVDLSALARLTMDRLQTQSPERRLVFKAVPEAVVSGDPGLLAAVMENLLGNAWKFTAMRDPAEIEFGAKREDGRTVYFVRDNGAGFNMAYLDKLFGAFQRLHSAREFSGTGVGLATVRRIVHRHGGQVWADGEVGKGATFYFTL